MLSIISISAFATARKVKGIQNHSLTLRFQKPDEQQWLLIKQVTGLVFQVECEKVPTEYSFALNGDLESTMTGICPLVEDRPIYSGVDANGQDTTVLRTYTEWHPQVALKEGDEKVGHCTVEEFSEDHYKGITIKNCVLVKKFD